MPGLCRPEIGNALGTYPTLDERVRVSELIDRTHHVSNTGRAPTDFRPRPESVLEYRESVTT